MRIDSIFILIVTFFLFSKGCDKIFITSIPKSGTHLLTKLMARIMGEELIDLHKASLMLNLPLNHHDIPFENVPKVFELSSYKCCWYHTPFSQNNLDLALRNKIKIVFIYRDPRDQVISWIKFIFREKYQQAALLEKLTFDEILMKCICEDVWTLIPDTLDGFYRHFLPWAACPNVYTTTFEKLVGSKGGGSDEDQSAEIHAIANHIGVDLSSLDLQNIGKDLFGGTWTFSEGQIGTWKRYFNDDHKKAFKKYAGQLLIDLNYETDHNW
jgi:sulfotransferase 6B1